MNRYYLVAILLFSWSYSARADNWPQWRGPERNGHVSSGTWPSSLKEPHLVQSWRVEMPPSYSGPVVSADRVFVTYSRGKEHEGVRALDRQTGKEVWKSEWKGAMTVAGLGTSMGSWIRATPALDGKRLYVFFGKSGVFCFDLDGKELWQTSVGDRTSGWGSGSSPLLYKNLLIVKIGRAHV